ncbi:MAG: glycogen synthase GlgA, partial [Proteobacteria bacterium]|nr:glycogen synthase GlgA [Pseudomonadota bacterium]
AGLDWQPDVLHANDWQTGLAIAFLSDYENRPKTVFTIHNLAYQGLYSKDVFDALDIPQPFWHSEGLEFYDQLSCIKGGLIYADHITTASPTYADEICSYEFGYGLEGLLSYRAGQGRLSGILNGIDEQEWDPAIDDNIAKNFSTKNLSNKRYNKIAIQEHFHLPVKEEILLIGLISRLVSQKGIDLSLEVIDRLLEADLAIQFVCLGSGEEEYEHNLRILRASFPDKVAIHIGYDEALAHQIEAGADVFLMPSRFEPCGLNQMYSLQYGTLPIVRSTGGLEDTVVDATEENRKNGTANGFKFESTSSEALEDTLYRVMDLFQHPRIWRKMMMTAMKQDFSWENSAKKYDVLYETIS